MAQPADYDPQTAFISVELGDPQFPGTEIDVELRNIQITTDQILANLALIQRDDGALANESVSFDQLDPAVLTSGIYPMTQWVTGTRYNQYQVVSEGTALYQATEAHTAGTFADDLAAGSWTEIVSLAIASPDLTAIEALTGTGVLHRTGAAAWSLGAVALGSEVSGDLPLANLAQGA